MRVEMPELIFGVPKTSSIPSRPGGGLHMRIPKAGEVLKPAAAVATTPTIIGREDTRRDVEINFTLVRTGLPIAVSKHEAGVFLRESGAGART
jgi:hypothetical protein